MKKKIKPIVQLAMAECGLCCAAMISQYYGFEKPINYFRSHLEIGRDGSNIKQIVKLFSTIGIEAKVYRVTSDICKNILSPAMVILDNKHFVVVERYIAKRCKYVVVDPAIGRYEIAENEFYDRMGIYIIITHVGNEFRKIKEKENVWAPFLRAIATEKVYFLLTILFSLVTYSFVLVMPIIIQQNIDGLIAKGSIAFALRDLIFMTLIILIFYCSNVIKNYFAIKFEANIDKKFLHIVLRKLLSLPYKFFETRTNGDLLFRLNLLNSIRSYVSDVLVGGILDFAGTIFAITYGFMASPILVLMMIVVFVFIFVSINKINDKIVQLNHYELNETTEITVGEAELVNSMYDIKVLGVEKNFFNKITSSHKKFLEKFKERNKWSKRNGSLLQFYQIFLPILMFILNVLNAKKFGISIGQIVAYYSVSAIMISNAISLIQKWTNLKLMRNTLSRVNDILNAESEKMGTKEISSFKNLEIKNVSFSYSGSAETIINNINIKINVGEKIGIVGASGSGKSTLIKLILGLYHTTEGEITVNNIKINEIKKDSLSNVIGVITQDATLFNKSINDNILIKKDNISNEEINEILKKVNIYDEVQKMPMKKETLISELGRNISGGQRQRIIMARTLINKPELLIMDEATSSLDGLKESEISNFLNDYHCTQLIISHRLSTIKHVDYVYVIDNGSVVEEGTIAELTNKKNLFYKLFKEQIEIEK